MAVAVDGASSSSIAASLTLSWTSHIVGGADRLICVGSSIADLVSEATGVTFAGTALTQVTGSPVTNGFEASMWRLIAPITGAQTVVITVDVATDIVGGEVSFTDVDQTTPLGTWAEATGTSDAPSVTVTSATDDIVIAVIASDATQAPVPGADQTERWDVDGGIVNGEGSTEPGAASVVMSATLAIVGLWAIGGVSVKAAGAAAGHPTMRRWEHVPHMTFHGRMAA